MKEMVMEVLESHETETIKNNIDIHTDFKEVEFVGDHSQIYTLLNNLIGNAIKYNKEHGRVKVVLDADHQYFTLEISDTGIGIPEEALGHIFERFYRVDKSHSREIGGTGLGLAIARSAVLRHKGSVKVSSVENEGTVFIVKIPLNYIAF